ncbi:EAL domain-containing protein [Psychrobium sp. 1_MG-2023]|uniref:EAL domain-containing protein n=1 Tax=Psychrobium sp. 1_MG-2023 TaxID=3062624 RepID=UPI000C32769B|nr:EAL domain-containing protein [Psychrobium sp. 1_MG-2023]MDP2562364.1 EAL domain-containing protein [Psychrobium sp. 1_MG-2023]PKF55870.1 hypothetical protein CW748_12110 [Alteromonadales bacterium alter-6D02]
MRLLIKRRAWSIFSALLLLLHFPSVANDNGNTRELDKVTLQLKFEHQFQFAGYYAAKEQGYYQEVGLDVHIEPAKIGDSATDAVLSGDANYGVGGSELLIKHSKGLPVVMLAVIFQHSPFVLVTPRGVSLSSLNHKTIGLSKNSHELLMMLKRAGVDKYHVPTQSYTLSDFTTGKLDALSAYITNSPFKLTKQGVDFDLHTARNYGVNFYGDNIFTSKYELEQHPQRAKRFMEASIKGWTYAMENPAEIAQLIHNKYQSKRNIESLLYEAKQLGYLIQPQLLEIGTSNKKRWQNIAKTYEELGLIKPNYDFKGFLYQREENNRTKVIYIVSAILLVVVIAILLLHISSLLRERQNSAHEMRFMNSILRTQQQASIDGIMTFDANGDLVNVNKQLRKLWGLQGDTFTPKDTWKIIYSMVRQLNNAQEFLATVRLHNNNPKMQSFAEIQLKDGRTFERFSAPLFHDDKSFLGRFWSFRDITERKLAEENIWLQANFDTLTNLPNRLMFKERLAFEIKKSQRSQKLIALLFLDLDRFKEINDSLGHDFGDKLLIKVALRLKQCVRDVDMVARLGGDEFTIIISELEHVNDIERIAQSILVALSTPFQINNQSLYISTSIGITFSPSDSDNDVQLLKNADQAMYHAKTLGRNNYQFFTPSLQSDALDRMALTNDLRHAIEKNQLFVVYQPIVSLETLKIVKAEALVRWRHPERGIVSPVEFISIAEETGLINNIGEWVFKQAVSQVKQWQDYHPGFQVAVNTSPIQYHSGSITPQKWHQHLAFNQVDSKLLTIELTESLLMESNASLLDTLRNFREQGTPISLDDFGTGYSSLSYLKKFDIDYLKIDRSFVNDLTRHSKESALCQAIITMAKSLGMQIVAEGIETKEQQQLLTEFGCDFGQGYLFSKPITANEFSNKLQQQADSLCQD